MKSKLLLSAFFGMAFLTLPVAASAQGVHTRTRTSLAPGAMLNAAKSMDVLRASTPRLQRVTEDPSQYGEVVTIISEDFSLITNGEVGNPDQSVEITHETADGNVWLNINDGLTHQPEWGGHSIYPAGGCISIYGSEGGNFNTPMLNVAGNDGVAFIRFRVRTDDNNTQFMGVEAAETNNMGPSWNVLGSYMIDDVTTEWKTYTFKFNGGGPTSLFNIYTYPTQRGQTCAIYIDDVEVLQARPYVHMPSALGHTDYTGTSFKAHWTKVAEADSYLLNLYHLQGTSPYGENILDTVFEARQVADTCYTVENVYSGDTYYYSVIAVKDGRRSYESSEMEVFDLATPVPSASALEKDATTYHVTWEAVPSAERYNYWAFTQREAEDDGLFTLTDENFNSARLPEGTGMTDEEWSKLTSDTPSQDNYQSLGNYVINPATQAGWIVRNGMPMSDGCLKVDGYQYYYNNTDAGLVSPELDLSKDNGHATLSVRLKGQPFTYQDYDNKTQTAYPRCAIAVFNWDAQKDDYTQTELHYISDVNGDWASKTVDLTTGTSRSVIGLYCVYAPENLFFDDLKITQNYEAGDKFLDPFFFAHWAEGTSLDVTLPWRAGNTPIYHRMNAVKSRPSSSPMGGADFTESNLSDMVEVGYYESTDVKTVSLGAASVQFDGNRLWVNCTGVASVYTLDGRQVATAKAVNGRASVTLPSGAYVVKADGNAVKVVF